MTRRHRTFIVFITSAAAATVGLNRLIHRYQTNASTDNNSSDLSLQFIESKLHLSDDLLKNKDNTYISIEPSDETSHLRYHQALQYIKQTHSTNTHIRERGLSHIAKLKHLPSTYYSILGQQLDLHSAVQLARTHEANSNLFPSGPPYIFTIGNKKILATDNVENVNDDDVLLHTMRGFLDKLIDNEKRPLDILSQHYLKLLESYLNEIDSQTVFDLGLHFEPEHADMSSKAIKRYRSNLELYSTFLYALRGYADRYPLDVIHHNGLQILKYLYEKRKENVPFVRFIGKILLLLSRDKRTHDAFYAVGWLRILHEMAIDENNIVYCLLGSTILANLDRPIHENEEKISWSKNIQPLHLSTEISNIELIEAEEKTEEKKEIAFEHQSTLKLPNAIDKFMRRVWYTRPVSDEDDIPVEIQDLKGNHEVDEEKNVVPDIDTSHSVNLDQTDDNEEKIEQEKAAPIPSWINDQVYGDKVILFSPTMYNVQQLDPDVRWHQEPIVDVIFFHGLAGSAFKTWRQESVQTELKVTEPLALPTDEKPLSVADEPPEEESDEVMDISEETNWNTSKKDLNTTTTTTPKLDEPQSTSCWPKDWLSNDVPTSHIRMLAVDYESRVSEWQVRSMPRNILRRSMHDRAQEIAEQLKQAGVGKRPIIWIAHSMGGLLTKYILTNEENEELKLNTRACVFFSVPHFGAELASFGLRHAFFVRPTVEIEELQPNSTNLLNLQERFLDMLKAHDNIKILSFAENEKTTFSLRYQTVVVPSESSQINIGKFYILNKNHIYICKPNSRTTLEYQELLDLIQSIYFERKNELKSEQTRATEEFLYNLYMFSSPSEDDMQ
ncbi:hypothetical protein I4U23_018987 [Adineta vaga]|nr:hypothetical protein I4U23_018987 [Adineta vaga]